MGGGGVEKSKLDQISSWAVDMQSVRLKKFWMPIQKDIPVNMYSINSAQNECEKINSCNH